MSGAVHPEIPLAENVTAEVDASSATKKVEDLISSNPVMLFSKSTCQFCFETKRTLESYGVKYAVFEVDKVSATAALQDALNEKTGFRTVPSLFIDGKSVGGCNTVKHLEHSREFQILISPFVSNEIPKEERVHHNTLFWFPDTLNGHAVRLGSAFTSIYCVFMAAFWDYPVTKWLVLALAVEFFFRLVFGGNYGIISGLAGAIVAPYPPKFIAGPSKQFAMFCGFFMSAMSAGFFLGDQREAGLAFIAGLAGASGLEGFLDFCLGCWMFGWGIKLGFLTPSLYRPHLNLMEDKKWANAYKNIKTPYYKAINEHYLLPGQFEETPVDLVRKVRHETEYKNQDYDVIRHTRIDFFAIPMSIAALALVFRLPGDMAYNGPFNEPIATWGTHRVHQGIYIGAVVIFLVLLVIYLLKIMLYPKKVVKEWNNPVMGNFFATVTITVSLFAILVFGRAKQFGIGLLWVSSVLQMTMTVFKISDLIYKPFGEENLNASLMMLPVGNFVSALGFAIYQLIYDGTERVDYLNISCIWFGVAALFAITLFVITFRKSLIDHHSDARLRPMLWIWIAASSMSGISYFFSSGGKEETATGVFFYSTLCISWFFFVTLGLGYVRGFYSMIPDMSIWTPCFSLCTLAIQHWIAFVYADGPENLIFAIILFVFATCSILVTLANTLAMVFDMSLFLPRPKWGPVSFMKLTHEAFRFSIPHLCKQVEKVCETNPVAMERLVSEIKGLFVTYAEHGKHEEEVLFPAARRYFPNLNLAMDAEHAYEHEVMERMETAVKNYESNVGSSIEEGKSGDKEKQQAEAAALLQVLRAELPAWGDHVLAHLRNEETTVTLAIRKYIPLAVQRDLAAAAFNSTSVEDWHVIIPFMMKNLPAPVWKARYLKAFIWGRPEFAQILGLMVYRTVDSVVWTFVSTEVPEIIPRGLPGHSKLY